jgi:alkanesulfonate monooxygenase SsuD/methylene tetrahydromethanopterin reductase-like flavin-dependent oxidoreductase (luciferase family)
MRFSLFYNFDIAPGKLIPALYREIGAQAVRADQLGYSTIWLAEHHFEIYGRMPSPLLFLARLSGLTDRIGLGTAVIEAPYYHPLRLVEDAALLDLMSGGRLRLGIGSGGRNKPTEFERFGVPIDEKGARTLEITEIMRQAFDRGVIDVDGAFYQFDQIEINPRPVQPARDLIVLAASESTLPYAAAHGYGLLIPRVGAAERHGDLIRRYRAAAGDRSGTIALLRFVYVAPTEREAQEQTRETIMRYARYDCGIDWDGRADTPEYRDLLLRLNAVIGTPDQVAAQLTAWRDTFGCDEMMCQMYAAGMEHHHALRSIDLLAQEVMPRFSRMSVDQIGEYRAG